MKELTLTPKELIERAWKLMQMREPFLVKGPPGIGKTDCMELAAEQAGFRCITFHPVICDPTDFKGFPVCINGKADFVPYGDLLELLEATEPTLAFIDDVGQAVDSVQKALMQPVLARRINGKPISDKVTFALATNRRQDGAGVKGLLQPLLSRITTIYEMGVEVEDWVEWALEKGMPPELIAFIQMRPNYLHDFDPKAKDKAGCTIVNQPCPRTLASAGRLINNGLDDLRTIAGAVGQKCAVELLAMIGTYKELGSMPVDIAKGKGPVDAPQDVSILYALSGALSSILKGKRCKPDSLQNISEWAMDKLPEEYQMQIIRDAERNSKLTEMKGYAVWSAHLHKFKR